MLREIKLYTLALFQDKYCNSKELEKPHQFLQTCGELTRLGRAQLNILKKKKKNFFFPNHIEHIKKTESEIMNHITVINQDETHIFGKCSEEAVGSTELSH